MKLIMAIAVLVVLVGGVATLWFLGIPPFKKAGKKPAKPAAKEAVVKQPPVTVSLDSAKPKPATQKRKPAAPALPDPAEERDLLRLASVYEQMPADDAGRILAEMPKPLLEKLLRRMDDRQVAKVLLTFEPKRAAALSTALVTPAVP
jgi:hypothetical protein